MTPEGYEIVTKAFQNTGLNVVVEPMPDEHEDVPYVTIISTGPRLIGADVLNILDENELGENRGFKGVPQQGAPELVVKTQTETSMTFVDKKARY